MEAKKLNFIKKYFGCPTHIGYEEVITSLGTMSIVPSDEYSNIFSGDAGRLFSIRQSEQEGKLVISMSDKTRKELEKELHLSNNFQ